MQKILAKIKFFARKFGEISSPNPSVEGMGRRGGTGRVAFFWQHPGDEHTEQHGSDRRGFQGGSIVCKGLSPLFL